MVDASGSLSTPVVSTLHAFNTGREIIDDFIHLALSSNCTFNTLLLIVRSKPSIPLSHLHMSVEFPIFNSNNSGSSFCFFCILSIAVFCEQRGLIHLRHTIQQIATVTKVSSVLINIRHRLRNKAESRIFGRNRRFFHNVRKNITLLIWHNHVLHRDDIYCAIFLYGHCLICRHFCIKHQTDISKAFSVHQCRKVLKRILQDRKCTITRHIIAQYSFICIYICNSDGNKLCQMFYFCSRSNNVLFRKLSIMNTEFDPFVDDAKSIFGSVYCAVTTRTLYGIICTFAFHFLRAIIPQILNPTFNRRLTVL